MNRLYLRLFKSETVWYIFTPSSKAIFDGLIKASPDVHIVVYSDDEAPKTIRLHEIIEVMDEPPPVLR